MVKIYFCCFQDWSDVKNVATRFAWGQFEVPQRSEACTFLLCFLTASITIQIHMNLCPLSFTTWHVLFKDKFCTFSIVLNSASMDPILLKEKILTL